MNLDFEQCDFMIKPLNKAEDRANIVSNQK